MGKKHFDDKNDLLSEMRRCRKFADNAISATFSAYMMMSCMILYEDFEYDAENIKAFVDGFYKRLDLYSSGKLTVSGIEKTLLEELGVYIEPPKVR